MRCVGAPWFAHLRLERSVFVFSLAAGLGLSVGYAECAAQIMDCRTVDCARRPACNREILRALSQLRGAFSEDIVHQQAVPMIQHRQEMLRSYYYPEKCVTSVTDATTRKRPWDALVRGWDWLAVEVSALAPSGDAVSALPAMLHPGGHFHADPGAVCRRLPPGATKDKCLDDTGASCPWLRDDDAARRACADNLLQRAERTAEFLKGRWFGWQGLSDNRMARLVFNVIRVNGSYVKACSDHGMVNGTIEADGSLVFRRLRNLEVDYRVKLWRQRGDDEELEGAMLLARDRSREVAVGPVWLFKTLESVDADPVADSCGDGSPDALPLGPKTRPLRLNEQFEDGSRP